MSALRFSFVIWVVIAVVLSTIFLSMGLSSTGKSVSIVILFKHFALGAVITFPILPVVYVLRKLRERRQNRSKADLESVIPNLAKLIESGEPVRFPYKPKKLIVVVSSILFPLVSYLLVTTAWSNEKEMLLFRLIELSVKETTAFLFMLALSSGYMTILSLLVLVRSLGKERFIIVGEDYITTPIRPYSAKIETVSFRDITGLAIRKVSSNRLLEIKHPGKKIVVPKTVFSTNSEYEKFVHLINLRAKLNHG